KNIYRVYLGAGTLMYALIALVGSSSKPLFVLCALVVLSFYGGGFATIPACLKDLFGTYQVGAIHGRLLTAWSTAGVLGPLIVNWIADRQEEAGKHGADLYGTSLLIMMALLAVGFVANELVRPVHPSHHLDAVTAEKGAPRARRQRAESA
ncbi:OFA family MFS transporter, partial [Streptomyces sp. SID7499]|nr:OFA family MFS transporter [Streptomyces sp. SID7499]